MPLSDLVKLFFLAAVWGGSFIFLRIAAPELGPLLTAMLRVGIASIALLAYAAITGVALEWRRNLKPYALVGLTAAALPFLCFSFAALHLPAAYSAVLNSTAPLFGAVLSVFWLSERLTARKAIGLLLGIAGVAALVGAGALPLNPQTLLAAAAALCAAASYAVSAVIVQRLARRPDRHAIKPIAMATGSIAWGALLLSPVLPFALPESLPSNAALASVSALALLSSALAQALFIPLIVRIGPTRAMSVSFMIPLFSMLWGTLFLAEAIQPAMLGGAALVLLAMALVLPASPLRTAPGTRHNTY